MGNTFFVHESLKWDTKKKKNYRKQCTLWKRYRASLGLPPDADEVSPRMVLRSHLGIGNAAAPLPAFSCCECESVDNESRTICKINIRKFNSIQNNSMNQR